MKNRRLNILFIAIIALAAAPQALQDVHRLANAAQERAENEFWSIFLSYQTPSAKGVEARGKTELLAERRSDTRSSCPLQRIAAVFEGANDSQASNGGVRTRSLRESRRANAKAQQAVPAQPAEAGDAGESLASLDAVPPVVFSEKEKSALKAASLHARDSDKLSGQLPKPAMAYSWEDDNVQIKLRPVIEMEKSLRRKARSDKERNRSGAELPEPPAEEGM